MRKSLLTVHIIASVGLFGSVAGLFVAGAWAATRDTMTEAHAIYELMSVLPFVLGIPFSFIALGTGVLLAVTSRWGLLRHWWVTGKLVLLVTTILVGALVSGTAMTDLADHTVAAADGDRSGEWTVVVVLGLQLAMILAASILAVFKPGGRIAWRRAPAGRSHHLDAGGRTTGKPSRAIR
jgi:hypothetical protein